MYKLEEDQEAYFLVDGSWLHECCSDWIYGFKYETMYYMQEGEDIREY